ncbi:LysM domain-containing protein [Synechococcus sp. 1G10]|uniref:LysM peptidoglycan-binding domain-containing protein n=1 Tax=Synechococcus sp. 1G10 TaxID=2025605 RepID=UPI000B9991A1|nr:LysM domain-containing protein [Synechococcus sp. 1G10]
MAPTPTSSPLQFVANVRLLLRQVDHPGAREPLTLARHVFECFIQQTKLISSRDNGPGVDTGDILCEGYLCRAAVLPHPAPDPWDWLDAELDWQTPGLRGEYQPPFVPPAITHSPTSTVQAPADGACWLGDLSLLETPGVLPHAPRAVFAAASLLMIGAVFGPGGIGALVQPELGEKLIFVIKPHRVYVLEAGDTLNSIAYRFGTTVPTLRRVNQDLQELQTIETAPGDTLTLLAGTYGTTVETLRKHNPELLRADGHTVVEGDTIRTIAELYDTTNRTIRKYNPPLAEYPSGDQLPLAMVVNVPAIRPSSPLDPGQELLVPSVTPSTVLPAGAWIYLPERRAVTFPDEIDLDAETPAPAALLLATALPLTL